MLFLQQRSLGKIVSSWHLLTQSPRHKNPFFPFSLSPFILSFSLSLSSYYFSPFSLVCGSTKPYPFRDYHSLTVECHSKKKNKKKASFVTPLNPLCPLIEREREKIIQSKKLLKPLKTKKERLSITLPFFLFFLVVFFSLFSMIFGCGF